MPFICGAFDSLSGVQILWFRKSISEAIFDSLKFNIAFTDIHVKIKEPHVYLKNVFIHVFILVTQAL